MKRVRFRHLWIALAFAASGCAQLPFLPAPAPDKPAAAAPQITEESLRDRARAQLSQGVTNFNAGEYDSAVKSLTASLEHGMLAKTDQSRARKFLAFSHCVVGRDTACRDEFRKAFEINPDFSLTLAEDGHPVWGPVYRNVRTQLITEREAAQRKPVTLMPLDRAEQMLADGMVKYDSGDYDAALRFLENALKEGLREKPDQVRAMKHVAFSLCLQEKQPTCRAAFLKIYDLQPDFDLSPAEAGHPSWTRTFASAKAQAKKAQQDKATKEAKEKARPAPPAAAVPKKN